MSLWFMLAVVENGKNKELRFPPKQRPDITVNWYLFLRRSTYKIYKKLITVNVFSCRKHIKVAQKPGISMSYIKNWKMYLYLKWSTFFIKYPVYCISVQQELCSIDVAIQHSANQLLFAFALFNLWKYHIFVCIEVQKRYCCIIRHVYFRRPRPSCV